MILTWKLVSDEVWRCGGVCGGGGCGGGLCEG